MSFPCRNTQKKIRHHQVRKRDSEDVTLVVGGLDGLQVVSSRHRSGGFRTAFDLQFAVYVVG